MTQKKVETTVVPSSKMKVRMKVSIVSANPEFAYNVGEVVLLDADRAKQWILVGHAEPAPDEPLTVETASLGPSLIDPRQYARIRRAGVV